MDRGYLNARLLFRLGLFLPGSGLGPQDGRTGVTLSGTVRTPEKATALAAAADHIHLFDGTAPGPSPGPDLRAASHVVLSIAPGPDGDPALQHRADLDAATNLQWLCYYSTIGVYGDFGGNWIDETAPLVPRNERSDRRVLAEQARRDYARERSVPLTILRLAGIYGPGRSAFDKLRDGSAHRIVKPGRCSIASMLPISGA
ncbi:hypothetical protein N8D56_03020 [Devosia sp. A8/3-2]|nr:hypothetical protein N8D56_03020 [Devosia sp. A8/3-2]